MQLPASAILGFDTRLPHNIAHCNPKFLAPVAHRGPVDLLGASWECQSISRVGRRQGVNDPRFRFFFNMIQIINFFQGEQIVPLTYLLENIYPGRTCTHAMQNTSNMVQGFIGAPVLIDAADVGSAAHRVREYWSNFLAPADLQAAMPTLMTPSPPMQQILHPYHIPCRPRYTDRRPFAPHNIARGARLCMPTVVSYLRSSAYRLAENGQPKEGEVYNTNIKRWEELDVLEKEVLLGYNRNETASPDVTKDDRSICLARALDANVMRCMGALLAAAQT